MVKGQEELTLQDILGFVPGMSQESVELQLQDAQDNGTKFPGVEPSGALDALLTNPEVRIPRWMRNPKHRALAEKLLASPLWVLSSERNKFTLALTRDHFNGTEATGLRMRRQLRQKGVHLKPRN